MAARTDTIPDSEACPWTLIHLFVFLDHVRRTHLNLARRNHPQLVIFGKT